MFSRNALFERVSLDPTFLPFLFFMIDASCEKDFMSSHIDKGTAALRQLSFHE